MKNIVILEPHEVGELWGEGLTLEFARGHNITIKAEGERLIMGKVQVLMVSAEGSGEELQTIVREFARIRLNGDATAIAPPDGKFTEFTPPPAASISAATPPSAVSPAEQPKQRRRAAKKPDGRGRYNGPALKCRYCPRMLGSPQARGKHESYEHPAQVKASKAGAKRGTDDGVRSASDKVHWCPKGCGESFHSKRWLNDHLSVAHGVMDPL